MKLEREKVSSTQLTLVNSVTLIGFESSLKDWSLKHHIHFSVNQESQKTQLALWLLLLSLEDQNALKISP